MRSSEGWHQLQRARSERPQSQVLSHILSDGASSLWDQHPMIRLTGNQGRSNQVFLQAASDGGKIACTHDQSDGVCLTSTQATETKRGNNTTGKTIGKDIHMFYSYDCQ